MSGILLAEYVPTDEAGKALNFYPNHSMVWVWIGGMALLTPAFLLLFRKLFNHKIGEPEEAA